MHIRTFVAPGFAENSYLAWKARSAVAIDPGSDSAALIDALRTENLQLDAILLTHAHIDHIEGVAALKRHADAPIYMHSADRAFYDNAGAQAAQFGMQVEKLPPVDKPFAHEQRLRVAGIEFEVRHVPGHSPGHVLLYVEEDKIAFVGDVVFQGSIGRTDLPGGSYQQLMQSIRNHVMTLPNETRLYCGHGPATTVQEERTYNPFIAPMYGGSFA
ncbi:MAG TPA: MBL fold metallo-hydrolase [Longimicrobiales bacterium]